METVKRRNQKLKIIRDHRGPPDIEISGKEVLGKEIKYNSNQVILYLLYYYFIIIIIKIY